MQVAALFLPTGTTKKVSTKKTPKFVEQKRTNIKICALLKGSVNGNQKNSKNSRRSGNR
jgi:hypothetical protein